MLEIQPQFRPALLILSSPRKHKRVDLISYVLPFGRLWYG
jgi:hypothetical protein